MSDGEKHRSLAGFWDRALRLLPGGGPSHQHGWEPPDAGAIHRSKTLKPFMEAVASAPSRVVVDLGPVVGSNVTFLGAHLACKIYPENLYADFDHPFGHGEGDHLARVLAAKLRQAPGTVDGILAWDVFDYLARAEAGVLAARLAALLRPGGVMMALFTTEPRDEAVSRRYIIVDAEHLRHRRAPGARWARRVWPLRDIEALLAPLEVVQSHLLAHHQREILLRRPADHGKGG